MDPDELMATVDDAVAALRLDLSRAREERQIDTRFLAVQGHLDGSGTFYGQADAQTTATIVGALDALADLPVSADGDGPTRAQQRMDAWLAMSEAVLSGGQTAGGTRPRPRLIATVDLADLQDRASAGARLLWNLVGRAPRLTPLATQTLLCDATITPVVFDGARPVAVGDATSVISSTLRTAMVARDGGCRFPGCGAPVAWCDAHHIIPRHKGGPTAMENLMLLCRRCHRRVHRRGWKVRMKPDGTITFDAPGQHYASSPRVHHRE
jgi:hypothetical protein